MNLRTVFSQVRLLVQSRPLPIEKPIVIQFPVIDICNSRCQMCRIWENKKSNDISVEQLKKGLESDLFSEVSGIGFNGGEPTLRADLIELVDVVIQSLPKLKSISLITNAFKYKQVIDQIELMGDLVKSKGLFFDVMVSLDGYKEVHDNVRGRIGNFNNAEKVIDFVKQSNVVDNLRIGCTVIRENVMQLPDLLEYCMDKNIYIKYRQGVPHQRLYTENLLDPYALTFEEKYEFSEFLEGLIKYYEPSSMQNYFYRSLIDQVIRNKPRAAGCDWKHRGATITAKGELAYCAVQSRPLMNNIADGDPFSAYFDNENHLKDIIKNKCDDCHHDYVGIPNKRVYRRLFLERLDEKFNIKTLIRATPGFTTLVKMRRKNCFNKVLRLHRESREVVNLPFKPEKKILICGWYGTETLGDKGIVAGVMHTFRSLYGDNVQFVVVSLNEYITEMTRRQMPEFKNCFIVSTLQAVQLTKDMEHVVFGGGPLMGIDELAPMQAIFERAKSYEVNTIVAGCGVGPFGEKWHNSSLRKILELSDVRVYRDQRSRDYSKKMGVNVVDDLVSEDPAFTWLATIEPKLNLSLITESVDEREVLLLGLRDFPYLEYARHLPEAKALAIKENYEKAVIIALKQLVAERPKLLIRPLPMCTNHFGGDDRWFYRRLFRNHKELHPFLDNSLLGPEMAPIEYCKAFKQANALLAMRFHSLVFGLGLGVSSVALDYTLGRGKVRSLAERYNTDLVSMLDLTAENLVCHIRNALTAERPKPISLDELSFSSCMKSRLKVVGE